jgi:hypothetical protein
MNGFDFNFFLDRIYRILSGLFFERSPEENAQPSSPSAREFIPYSLPMVSYNHIEIMGIGCCRNFSAVRRIG